VSEKTKHIDVKWHFLKDHVEHGTIMLRYLPTNRMVTDVFSKPLSGHALTKHKIAIMGGADPLHCFIM
jgi:hypothetical protein